MGNGLNRTVAGCCRIEWSKGWRNPGLRVENEPVGHESEKWLGRRDSNPDTQIQSLQSYR